LAVGSTWLILQKEVVLEESEIGVDGEVSLAEVDEDGDLENRIRIKMDKFNLDVVMESTEEIASWQPESLLKKGFGYHYFVGIWGGDLLTFCQQPLENDTGGRRWSFTNLRISFSSVEDVLNIFGCETAMGANEKVLGGESENDIDSGSESNDES
jgi:hypothetical protein